MGFFLELKRRNVIRMAIVYGVSAWLLLQVGDLLFDLLGVPDWSLRLLLGILLLGFPLALVFSWVYELTPDGLRREREVNPDQSIAGHTARKLDMVVIGLLVLSLAIFAADRSGLLPGSGPSPSIANQTESANADDSTPVEIAADAPADSSIAVLPFVNMSSDPEQEYFSDGLAESLLHSLAQIDNLHVAARTSSFRFRNHVGDVADIGRQLRVANVLEGSVRRSGDTLRITAQLIKADDGYHLWSGTYDRKLEDVFAIQDEIAGHVVTALKVALLGEDAVAIASSRDTQNLVAYEAYLKGRQELAIDSHQALPKAESWFKQALEHDPDYLLALASLGETYVTMARTGQIPRAEMAERIKPVAQHILALNPDSGAALTLLAYGSWVQNKAAVARRLFQQAYERTPRDNFVSTHYARFLRFHGDHFGAVDVLTRALENDPLSSDLHIDMAYSYSDATSGDWEKALWHAGRARMLEPGSPSAVGISSQVHAYQGRYVAAIKDMAMARELDPNDYELPADYAMHLLAFGQTEAAAEEIRLARSMFADGLLPQAAEAALLYREGDLAGADMIARNIAKRGMEPRRWGPYAVTLIMRDSALVSGEHENFLKLWGDWLEFDLSSAELTEHQDRRKILAVPVLRAAGQVELAAAIVEATLAASPEPAGIDAAEQAVALQDIDLLIPALERRLAGGGIDHTWLLLRSAVVDFARDDPRFKRLVALHLVNEIKQARLWELHQKEHP